MMRSIMIIITCLLTFTGYAQNSFLTIDQAVDEALKNNASVQAVNLESAAQKQLRKTSFNLPKTDFMLMYGQYNSYANDNNVTISQSIPFSAFGSQGGLNRALAASSELNKAATENEIVYQVKQAYYHLAFVRARHQLLLRQDSIFEGFLKSASLRYKTGETNLLEQTTAEAQLNESKNQLRQNEADIAVAVTQLKTLMNRKSFSDISVASLTAHQSDIAFDTGAYASNPNLAYKRQQIEVAQNEKKVQASRLAPDIMVGFFSQTLIGTLNNDNGYIAKQRDRFTGFQVGVAIPLWFAPYQARVKAAEYSKQAAKSNYEYYELSLQAEREKATRQLTTNRISLDYYTTSALPNADLILKQAHTAFQAGEIGYAEYLMGIRNAINIRESYLRTLNAYNQSIIYIEYLTGQK